MICCRLISLIPLAVVTLLLVNPISRMPVARSFRAAVVLVIFSQGVSASFQQRHGNAAVFQPGPPGSLLLRAGQSGGSQRTGRRPGLRIRHNRVPDASRGSDPRRLDRLLRIFAAAGYKPVVAGGLIFAVAALSLVLVLHSTYGTVLPNAFYIKQGGISAPQH